MHEQYLHIVQDIDPYAPKPNKTDIKMTYFFDTAIETKMAKKNNNITKLPFL